MKNEINLLKNYPSTKRNLQEASVERTDQVRKVARKFDKEFFDGERKYGYGGYYYDPRFWTNVVKDFIDYYKLDDGSKILDVGCGKGFMMLDFLKANKNLIVKGIDISNYAIENCMDEVKNLVSVGNAKDLKFQDNEFDLVISINTVHNLELKECTKALQEMERVSKKNKYVILDAYKNDEEKERMFKWNLTAKTIFHTEDWKKLFGDCGYNGDYYWFNP
uniref:SAM binding protein n=1 Tax=Pelagibacter ubique TaxID=198252 RepID=B1A0Q7_PELUQ|nr:SAM binding protein [Candidatus Pelagibacter ubique]